LPDEPNETHEEDYGQEMNVGVSRQRKKNAVISTLKHSKELLVPSRPNLLDIYGMNKVKGVDSSAQTSGGNNNSAY